MDATSSEASMVWLAASCGMAAEVLASIDIGHIGHPATRLALRIIAKLESDGAPVTFPAIVEHATGTDEDDQLPGLMDLVRDALPVFPTDLSHYAEKIRLAASWRLLEASKVQLEEDMRSGGELAEVIAAQTVRLEAAGALSVKALASPVKDSVIRRLEELCNRKDGDEPGAVHTGFADLDELMGPMLPGEFVLLAARPSIGKTAMALSMASKIGRTSRRVGIYSLEMTEAGLLDRLLGSAAGVDSRVLQNPGKWAGHVGDDLGHAALELAGMGIYIDDRSELTVPQIRSAAKLEKLRNGLDCLFVDYLQLAGSGKDIEENPVQEITEVSKGMKAMAKTLGVVVVALSQLKRISAGQRPDLIDLRGSGSLEQDADKVIFLHRDDYGKAAQGRHSIIEAIVAKNRNGPIGSAFIKANLSNGRFGDLSEHDKDKHGITQDGEVSWRKRTDG